MTDQAETKARHKKSGVLLFGWAMTTVGAGIAFGAGGVLMSIGVVLIIAVIVDELADKIRTRS